MTIAILYMGEIVPKVLASIHNEAISPVLGRPLFYVMGLMTPLIYITELFSKRLRGKANQSAMSVTDIEVLAQLAKARNLIAHEQEEIILSALSLRTVMVSDNMIPREWIVFLRLDLDNVANFKIGQHAMHTRYPVSFNDSADKIMGYINYKDLIGFRPHGEDLNLEAFIRPIVSLKPDMDLNTALKILSAKRHHIALVKENDVVVGLITMEDVIEELVGDIEDEFDMSSATMIPVTDKIWRVGASITMDKISHIIGHEIEEIHEQKTLGHWLNEKIDQKKFPGASYVKNNTRFTVQQARQGKVFQVIIESLDA